MATVRKRVRIGADGKEKIAWVADYFDHKKRRHLKTFQTRKDADAWLVETRGEIARGVHTPERQSISVYEASELWLKRGEVEDLERGTMRGYGAIVRLHITPTLGATKLAHLTTPMLEGWRDRLVSRSSRRLARKVLGILKAILTEAQRRGLIAHNPALPVKVDLKRRDVARLTVGLDIPSKEDVQKLLAAVTGRHRPLIVTAIFTGMRASELRGLAWDAVDFDKKTITVRRRADEWGVIGSPKSGAGRRTIPMSPTVFNTLREWKLTCPKGDLDLVFPNSIGKVEPLTNITQRAWHPLQRKLGMVVPDPEKKDEDGNPVMQPRYNFHTLRHFAASLWIELGFTPKRLQAMLGHASVQVTFDRYGHLFPSLEDDHAKLAKGEIGLVA